MTEREKERKTDSENERKRDIASKIEREKVKKSEREKERKRDGKARQYLVLLAGGVLDGKNLEGCSVGRVSLQGACEWQLRVVGQGGVLTDGKKEKEILRAKDKERKRERPKERKT